MLCLQYFVFVVLIPVGISRSPSLACKKENVETVCEWKGAASRYAVADGEKFVSFERFFKPATVDLPASVQRLIIQKTDFECKDFPTIRVVVLNHTPCPSPQSSKMQSTVWRSAQPDTQPTVHQLQTPRLVQHSSTQSTTEKSMLGVNVTMLPILGPLKKAGVPNLTVIIVLAGLGGILVLAIAGAIVRRRCKRRQMRHMMDDTSVNEFQFPLRKLD